MHRVMYRRLGIALILLAGLVPRLPAQALPESHHLGRQYFAEGNYAAAEEAFTRELLIPQKRSTAYYNRAQARFNQRNYAGAKADLDAHLALAPSSLAYAFRASVRLLLDDAAGAVADADEALKNGSGDGEALLVRGKGRARLGQYDGALSDFTSVLKTQPRHVAALLARGDALLATGNLAGAGADFLLAAEISPHDPDPPYKQGLLHFRALNPAAALPQLETAARLAPHVPHVWRALGYVHYANGNWDAAIPLFERAIALGSAHEPYAHFALHLSAKRAGRTGPPLPVMAPGGAVPAWPDIINGFLHGAVTEDDLLLSAQNLPPPGARRGRGCEAYFYIGTTRLLSGDVRGARYAFQEAVATEADSFTEHVLARAELARLTDLPDPPKPRPSRRR